MSDEMKFTPKGPVKPIEQESYGRLPQPRGKLFGVSDELWAPLILFWAAQVIWLGMGLYFAGTGNLALGMFASLLLIIQSVVVTTVVIAACFLVAFL